MTSPDRGELVKLNEAGLEAAVRECARITAPEITNDEYERIKAENSPRYQNTRTEMARAIRAYLRAAKPAPSSIVTCCVTGAIPGDGGACGDCDPCLLGEASVPAPVKTLIAEKNSLIHRVGELEDELDSLRRLASSDGGVKVRELEWEDADEGMCTKWRACALGGHYELVALDGDGGGLAVNFYWGRPLSFWFIQGEPDEWGPTGPKMFPTLDEAKAAAQRDYEARIKSALIAAPPADAGMREALDNACDRLQHFLDTFGDLGDCVTQADIDDWRAASAPRDKDAYNLLLRVMTQVENDLASAHAEICRLQGLDPSQHAWPEWTTQANTLRWFQDIRNRFILTAPGATTESDGGGPTDAQCQQALRLLTAEDERQSKLHDLLETIREQIRTGVEPEHRPEGLFDNIQNAVYAMRGRTPLMNDAAITAYLAQAGKEGWVMVPKIILDAQATSTTPVQRNLSTLAAAQNGGE